MRRIGCSSISEKTALTQANIYFYNDNGGVQPPAGYAVQYWNGAAWLIAASPVKSPAVPAAGLNTVSFAQTTATKFRIVFTHRGGGVYSGVTEVEWQ